jgi:hypothetical protein
MAVAALSGKASWGAGAMPEAEQARLAHGLSYCARFFMGASEAHKALDRLVGILDAEGIPYAIIGGLALNAYGHVRATVDVDVVMREEDLQRFKRDHLGRGYEERVAGTGKLLDTENGVHVDVLSTGRFPGDGKPKPVAFPDPALTAVRGDRFAMLPLACFLELKLASGMTAPHRLHDLADVLDLIRSARLPATTADDLHPWVRDKFMELWNAAQGEDAF